MQTQGRTMPERITLSRAKGWRMPANTVKVDRTTKWGNPFVGDPAACVAAFRDLYTGSCKVSVGPDLPIKGMAFIPPFHLPDVTELRGKNLACWCKPGEPCHADVLLELANGPYPEDGWLIHKAGRGWYRSDASGYTSNPVEAGRYSRGDAIRHSHPNGPSGPRDGMTIRHESEVTNA